jgi:hypothetical protein
MFEKEAENYVDKELKPPVIKPMVEICKECIEIGYNIGKEEQKHNTHTVAHFNDCISEAQIEKMKKELHYRLVNPSHDDSDCLDKIVGLDRLWQFGQEF